MKNKIQNRQQFIKYCLVENGQGFAKINISEEQLSDRVDDAIELFTEYHFSGSTTEYILFKLTKDQAEKQEIILPENVTSVVRLIQNSTSSSVFVGGSENLLSQQNINLMFGRMSKDLASGTSGLQNYVIVSSYLSLMDNILNWSKNFRYNQYDRKLKLDTRCYEDMMILVECNKELDINQLTEAYNNRWLKKYASALIARQWGKNLKKFANTQVTSGVSLNSDKILSDAEAEIEKLEIELKNTYARQVYLFRG